MLDVINLLEGIEECVISYDRKYTSKAPEDLDNEYEVLHVIGVDNKNFTVKDYMPHVIRKTSKIIGNFN